MMEGFAKGKARRQEMEGFELIIQERDGGAFVRAWSRQLGDPKGLI